MNSIVIIPCAGKATSWNRHLGIEKQLIPISASGETNLARTVRLLNRYGIEDVQIVTSSSEIRDKITGASFLNPDRKRYLADTLNSSQGVWQERNIVLLGDVYFTRNTIQTILSDDHDIRFFGRSENNPMAVHLGYRREIFGFSFSLLHRKQVIKALQLNSLLAHFRDSATRKWLWSPKRLKYLLDLDLNSPDIGISRFNILKLLFLSCITPNPPEKLMQIGFQQSQFWRVVRFLSSTVRGDSANFGKLWGIHDTLLTDKTLYESDSSHLKDRSPLFHEINDITQDCDVPGDYDRLSFLLDILRSDSLDRFTATNELN